jgi:hypothetical protein
VDEPTVGGFPEQIDPGISYLRQFGVVPARDRESGQFFQHPARQAHQNALQRNVVFVHRRLYSVGARGNSLVFFASLIQ